MKVGVEVGVGSGRRWRKAFSPWGAFGGVWRKAFSPSPFAFAFAFVFAFIGSLGAGVPLFWRVETSRPQPAAFDCYRGETLDLDAAFLAYGRQLDLTGKAAEIFWQTNGMGSAWWRTNAAVCVGNHVRARFTPEMDPGGAAVRGFLGVAGDNYRGAFTLRIRDAPGADPGVLPPPRRVLDFATVEVRNAPYYTKEEVDGRIAAATNALGAALRAEIAGATNLVRGADGAARPLPKYLHALDFADSYPDEAEEYYRQREEEAKVEGEGEQRNSTSTVGLGPSPSPNPFACSSVRSGGFLYRNFDFPFDERAEFVVRVSGNADGRFASVGVAQVGTNLTEQIVTSGRPSRCYKWLPGATVDGVNERGVAAEINVVGGDPATSGWHSGGDLHPLAAVRWALDHATNAQHAAEHVAANVRFPAGWTQNFHWMIADVSQTWIVENGSAHDVTDGVKVMTNFRLFPERDTAGEGQERYDALAGGANITSQWWTLTYTPAGCRASDLPGLDTNLLFRVWAASPRESHRGETLGGETWWQTVHTSIYDLTNRTLKVAVQETDDWYVFAVPAAGRIDAYTKEEVDEKLRRKEMRFSVTNNTLVITSGAVPD